MENDERQERIDAVRAICDFVEKHPGLKLPFDIGVSGTWGVYQLKKDEFIEYARAFGYLGESGKSTDGDYLVIRRFGPIELTAYSPPSEVCGTVPAPRLLPEVELALFEARTEDALDAMAA